MEYVPLLTSDGRWAFNITVIKFFIFILYSFYDLFFLLIYFFILIIITYFQTICYQEYCNDEVVKAITDSGTSLLYGPAEIVSEILAKIGVDETDGTIPCNVDIKPLVLKIGTKEYQLPKVKNN